MQQKSVRSSSESYFWPTVWAVAIHVLLFAMLFVSFHFAPELPPAKPIVQATLYQLKSQSKATTQTTQKIAGEAEKTKARQYEVEQMETKKEEQQKQEAAEQKKAEAAKQAEVAKKQAEAKVEEAKKAEQKKQADIAKKKAEDEKKKAAEDAKKKAAEAAKKKAAEEAKKKAAAAAAKKKAQDAARKAVDDKKAQALAELLGDTTERQQALAETQGDQVAGDFDDLIRRYVSEGWSRPPSARNGMTVVVQINMLPDGTITNATVARSSGDAAFDSSAVTAVRNVGKVTEMQGLSPSDFNPYRSFKMTFTPEDLDL